MTRICIYGAGAIGSHFAVRLAQCPGVSLSLIARGEHLVTIQNNGLTLETDSGNVHATISQAVGHARNLPPQDIVIVGLKATDIADHAQHIGSLLTDNGIAVFINNGIPWWWGYGLDAALTRAAAESNADTPTLALLDPDGALWSHIRPERVIGGVVYSPNEIVKPGHVRHRGQTRILLGEPAPQAVAKSTRLSALIKLLNSAGLTATAAKDIRASVWEKLLVNIANNTICALTRLDNQARMRSPDLFNLGRTLQAEIRAVAAAMGWSVPPAVESRPTVETAAPAPGHRPSMLQDVLRGRALEVDALVGQPLQFARQFGIATPVLTLVHTLLSGLDCSVKQQAARAPDHA
ncbi:ketopantoate reductase family protein [Advenella mimigardefordensis]|uniref:2-dehydropantoate 2-reductase n=1 Tax=Advenella mimigardefordensis (strain DSM 17166 / LMG 22922 / DPN7) TaxID=1247726 RepID=W0PFU9_ADVMD|nr:2-dehydropantoate 2-reductase [Advenella mimigardefordensis]AHG65556.1 putative 2-dehydropantoate 2-reductase [Advenella mimigardefordensis DPN7]